MGCKWAGIPIPLAAPTKNLQICFAKVGFALAATKHTRSKEELK